MPTDPNEPSARPEQPNENFGEGQEDAARFPADEAVGRFDEGQDKLPEDDPEKIHHGRFSEGQEKLPEDDPEKHEEGRFDEGQTDTPPRYTP